MKARGFIVQASYRVEAALGRRLLPAEALTGVRPLPSETPPSAQRVAVVQLYGKLENGETFLVRDDRQRPCFFIRANDAARASELGMPLPAATDRRTLAGEPACRIEAEAPSDVPRLRERLHAAGIETFEADVRFAVRYLIERGIKGGCEIEGGALRGKGVSWVFENPEITPAAVEIEPRVLSFDIETDPKATRLLAISLYAPGFDEVLIVEGEGRAMPEHAVSCADERAALDAFCARVAELDPDVLTGWNTIDFDLAVLERIAARLGHGLPLGRGPGRLRLRKPQGYFGSGQATIPGRLVLDGIDLLRGAFVRMDDYSLDAVAREVLGEGKAVQGDARDRIGEIMHNYRHNLDAFALYARTDARLAYQIVERLDLVRLAFARSRLTGMTPDRVAASIASFDFLYLTELERLGLVAPSVRGDDARVHAAQQGGHVLEPAAGMHGNVWVFDFKSLYPSIIRSFNIDPLSYLPEPDSADDPIRTPAAAFRREPAILPRMLDELFPRREAAKRQGDKVAAHAIKILMNSFYGVLGTPACRFYNPALANAITGMGRELLLWSKRWFEGAGFKVLYGDTDSLFVASGRDDASRAEEDGRALAAELNRELARYVEAQWRVSSRLEIEFEKLYLKLFLLHARGSTRGASKRYAGLLHGGGVEFVGMEVVRRDWTALAKEVQRELYGRLFAEAPVVDYLAEIVKRLRSGELDEALVYRKQLRKRAAEYTATTPPHVAAARKSSQSGRLISYVMTTAGAEPLDNVRHEIDREHYVAKQVRPVAEPVLEALGLEFERVIGDARQVDWLSP
ncbi:MAG TPA: DNA polymerase II [Gammaproteobacteria bacterium]|nr:DNA polymerase II [Gammaproteobacteria bacterium]